MATSGEIDGNHVIVSGGSYARLRIDWQLASQNYGGNYSTINWQAYIDFVGCDAQLDNGHVNTNVGAVYNNGGRVYNYTGNFSNHTVTMGSGSFNIGHNNDGTQVLQMNGSIDVYQSGTSSCGTTTWSLPTIPRYASISSLTYSNIHTAQFDVNITVDNTCSLLECSLDGGASWFTIHNGSYSSLTQTVTGLTPNTSYSVAVRVTRQDSGLTTTSGVSTVKTLAAGGFFASDM